MECILLYSVLNLIQSHNMSSYGITRVLDDLISLGYRVVEHLQAKNQQYVVIRDYEIEFGRFAGRVIDLALLIPSDYPRTVGSSIQVKSSPHLLVRENNVPGKINILDSPIGPDWKYWSFRFKIVQDDPTKNIMTQVNGIFRNI